MNTEQQGQVSAKPKAVAKKGNINFGKLAKDMKKHKKLYYKVLPIVFLLSAIFTLGIPNTFKCTVTLAPEMSSAARRSTLANLVSSFGINLGTPTTGDAILPTLYPELMNSVTFRTSLFPIKVHREDDDKVMTYYDYLLNEQKSSWWAIPIKALFSLLKSDEDDLDSNSLNSFKLTKKQTRVVEKIEKNVVCDVDKKSLVITIDVKDQDPLIAATIADSVQKKLQDFITEYRTTKARIDVEYYKALCQESKERYEKALNDYAVFSDRNQKVFLQSVHSQQVKLETELNLQQQAYTQISAQLQMAEAKLQEDTPAFTTLQPATVPIKKSAPARAKICLVFLFLAFMATTAVIFHREGDLLPLLGIDSE